MAILSPSEIVTISVSNPPAGLAPYSINNLLVLTKDTPVVALTGAYEVYTNPADVLTQWGSDSNVYEAAIAIFAQTPNILSGGGKLLVAPMLEAELLGEAITRLSALVFFGGVSYTFAELAANILTAGATAQAARKKLFVGSATGSDLTDGLLFDIKDQTLTRARGLFHSDAAELPGMVWSYASQAQSTDFSGVNTTRTMHLKQLAGVASDTGLTSTVVTNAKACGADIYGSIAGRPSLLTSGANGFYDDVYNLDAFVADLEVAGFNALAQAGTKIPQTETGMIYLKDAYSKVCEKYVRNGFIGAGTWTGSGTFGDPETFQRSIREQGFYVYSVPLALQTQADREDRKAPLVMIAIKYQGAIHSTSVMVAVNR